MSKINPSVSIMLDRERHLFLDLNAMVGFEEKTGKNMLAGGVGVNLSATDLRALLWSCLRGEDPTLTMEQVGSFITPENMANVAESLAAAWKQALPEANKERGPLVVKPPAG